MFHCDEPLTETVWEKLMGANHQKVVPDGAPVHQSLRAGEERVERTILQSQPGELKQWLERRLEKKKFWGLLVDATPFQGQQIVAALGIDHDGTKANCSAT